MTSSESMMLLSSRQRRAYALGPRCDAEDQLMKLRALYHADEPMPTTLLRGARRHVIGRLQALSEQPQDRQQDVRRIRLQIKWLTHWATIIQAEMSSRGVRR